MQDLLIGTWQLNAERSNFDANHKPRAATMIFEMGSDGDYMLTAEGITEKGEKCRERPTRFVADGREHPVPDFPGLIAVTTRTDAHTLTSEVRREDGSVVGGGSYVVSPDGASLTAITFGYDTQLRQFKQQTVWDRQ